MLGLSGSRLGTVFVKEFMERVKTKGFIISTVLGPIILVALILGPAWLAERGESSGLRVAVLDEGHLLPDLVQLSELHWSERETAPLIFEPYEGVVNADALEELNSLVLAGNYAAILELPADFYTSGEASFHADQIGRIDRGRDLLRPLLTQLLQHQRLSDRGIAAGDLQAVLTPAHLRAHHLGSEEIGEEGIMARKILSIIMGMMLYMLLLQYGMQVMMSVVEDKTSRVVEVMLASVRPSELMAGKMFAQAAVGLGQVIFWAASVMLALKVMGQALPMDFSIDASVIPISVWFYFGIFFLLGYLMFSSLYAAVGAMSNSIQDAQPLSQPITFAIIIPFLLSFTAMQDPDASWVQGVSFFPLCTPMVMFARIMSGKPELWEISLSIVILALTTWVFARLAGKLFRLSILDFGGAKSWKQVWALIRADD